jgi:transposase
MSETKRTPSGGYPQQWSAYNQAQTNEKRHFLALLYQLCQCVEEPEQIAGRPRLPLGDMIFCAVIKVYLTFSTRRICTDLAEAHAKGLISSVPHFNSIVNYFGTKSLTICLQQLIEVSSMPMKLFEVDFAADSTGLSTYQFFEWYNERYGRKLTKRNWVKLHVMCGVRTNIITYATVTPGSASDYRQFEELVKGTARNFKISEVSADLAYLGAQNMRLVLLQGGTPYIAFKSNSTADGEPKSTFWKRMLHLYRDHYPEFSEHYNKRNNVETTHFMLKAKFGGRLRSKSPRAQINEALCKVVCHNLCVLIQSMYELKIELNFDGDIKITPQKEVVVEPTIQPIAGGRIVALINKRDTESPRDDTPTQQLQQMRLFE